jgi:Tfp pilus assembly protein PilE
VSHVSHYIFRRTVQLGGFTIVELLLAVGVIGVLAGVVITMINPRQQVAGSYDAKREADVNTLIKAMNNYHWGEGEMLQESTIPSGSDNAIPICTEGASDAGCTNSGGVSLDDLVALDYLSAIPQDEAEGCQYLSGYSVYKDAGRALILADHMGTVPSDVTAGCPAVPGITINPTSGLTTTEAGGTAQFTVVLDSEPTGDVVIGISSDDTSEGTPDTASLTFTTANWNTAQTVTITGQDDGLNDGDIGYWIVTAAATSSDANYNNMNASDVSVTNTDDDEPSAGITVNPTSGLTTTEAGGTAQFTVVLDTAPTASVTIGISSSDTSEGTVSASSLTFTTGNWSTAQTVTTTGQDDALTDGNIAYSIVTAVATSSDTDYNGMNASDVSVSNTDNDTAGITVNPTSGLTTTEAGGTAQFTVVLDSEPTANVTIGISSNDTTEGTPSTASLTFTAANWDTAQTITITGQDDALTDGDIAYSIVTAAATSSDSNYNGMNASNVSVTNTDDEGGSCPDFSCDEYEECMDDCSYEPYCGDGVDNDQDGDTDCFDFDCSADLLCSGPYCGDFSCDEYEQCMDDCSYEPYCGDGVDNDQDGDYDCSDFDCSEDPLCGGGSSSF